MFIILYVVMYVSVCTQKHNYTNGVCTCGTNELCEFTMIPSYIHSLSYHIFGELGLIVTYYVLVMSKKMN